MAYSDLKTDIANYLHRADLTSAIPGFITKAEARLNRALQLRTMEQEDVLSASIGSRTIAIPTGMLSPIQLWITPDQERYSIPFRLPKEIEVVSTNGTPEYWTIDNLTIAFDCPASSAMAVDFRYYKAFALSDAEPTNWLLENAPDLYLYASLLEAVLYIKDDSRIPTWQALYSQALSELSDKEHRAKALAPLVTELGGSRKSLFSISRGY